MKRSCVCASACESLETEKANIIDEHWATDDLHKYATSEGLRGQHVCLVVQSKGKGKGRIP